MDLCFFWISLRTWGIRNQTGLHTDGMEQNIGVDCTWRTTQTERHHHALCCRLIRFEVPTQERILQTREFLTAVLLMARDFCNMTLCRRASCYGRFKGAILRNDDSHSPTTYRHILDELQKENIFKTEKLHRFYQKGRAVIREYVLVIDITKHPRLNGTEIMTPENVVFL